MNPLRFFLSGCVITPFLLLFSCSLPSDTEPAKWQVYMEIPVTEERFNARDLLPDDMVPGFELSFGNSDSSDTITLIKTDSLFYMIEQEMVTADSSILEEKLGAITLENTPVINVMFALMEGNDNGTLSGVPLPFEVPIDQSTNEPVDGVQSVLFDESSLPLEITVTNRSDDVDLHDIHISILDYENLLGQISIPLLESGLSEIKSFSVSDKTVRDSITISVQATIPEGSVVNLDDGIEVKFSLDGLAAAEAIISDTMINYSDIFTGSFGLADQIALDAIDLDDARLLCEIINPSSIQIELNGVIDNAWERDFAEEENLKSIDQLSAIKDSSSFAGNIIFDTLFQSQSSTVSSFIIPLNHMRLFPSWNADSGKSMLNYRFAIQSVSDKRHIHFNKNDTWVFKLKAQQFPFIQITGTFVDSIEESFSSGQEISFGWEADIIDSLKKNFRFQSVVMALELVPDMPPKSSLDSIRLHMDLSSNVNSNDPLIVNEKLENVIPDSMYFRNIEVTSLINEWPDKIEFDSRIVLPKQTGITLFNTKDEFGEYTNTLAIGVNINWKIRIPFAWQILDTIVTELESSSFTLDIEELDWINKIEKTRVKIDLNAFNNTNLNIIVHALGASERYKKELMSFPDSVIGSKDLENRLGDNIFCLFGQNGLEVAPRGKESNATAQLDYKGINALLSNDECIVRWFLVMPSSDPDQFMSTDYLDLKATAVVEGIGRTDSLLYWED